MSGLCKGQLMSSRPLDQPQRRLVRQTSARIPRYRQLTDDRCCSDVTSETGVILPGNKHQKRSSQLGRAKATKQSGGWVARLLNMAMVATMTSTILLTIEIGLA